MTNDFGIIATETGVDVEGAPDYRQVMNSNWPTLEVEFEQIISVNVNTVAFNNFKVEIFTHNLGYIPAYTYIDVSGYNGLGTGYPTGVNDSFTITLDKNKAYVVGFAGGAYTFAVRGLLRIYKYDPLVSFQAPFYTPRDPKSQHESYGIAALKNGFDGDIAGEDYSKFSVNSRAKSLTIHQSGLADASSGSFTITHNLGYLPSFMTFAYDGTYFSDQAPVRSHGNQNSVTFNGIQSPLAGNYAYIVFKDPVMQQQV